jgi:outer membrane protein OmpA-like peptidoglycan-associated protein
MNTKPLKMIAVILAAACFPVSALAVDTVILRGGDMQFRVSLGMSEQDLAQTVGAPDILKNNGSCYQYRVFDVSIMLDDERRVQEIYAGRNFSGAIVKDDGTEVPIVRDNADSDSDEATPMKHIFKEFGEPLETVRRAYAPSTEITSAVTSETESVPSSTGSAAQALPLEYRGDRVLYELYNGPGVAKYKYVLDKQGIAFWLDADKQPYATVVYRTPPPAIPVAVPKEEPLIVYFDFDRDAIKDEYVAALDKQAARLRDEATLCVSIEGHADEKGTDPYNDGLSMRRARAVLNFLAARNVPAERMKVAAFGKREPAAANRTPEGLDNPAGRALNRRVRIHTVACGN